MSKNKKKNNKVKLSAADTALLCGVLHLDCGKMVKYDKKIIKNNPDLRKMMNLIGKDTKAYLALMIGYHIAKIEKINKKKKKVVAKSRKSNKKCQAKDEFYWQTETNRNFAGNTDGLFDLELPPLGTLPSDINNKAEAAVNTTANTEKPQDKQSDDKPVCPVGKDANSEPIRRVSPFDVIGAARIFSVYESEPGIRVAGCIVCNGKLKVNTKAQVIRNGRVICEGTITKLKRFKNEVDEVNRGFETGVVLDNCDDIRHNDFIECFEAEPDTDSTVNTDNDNTILQPVDKTVPNQYTVPQFINGDHFKILVTDVDTENNTLTYLDLGEYSNTTPAKAPAALSAIGAISEEDHRKLAEEFGIDPEWVATGIDDIRTELPTKKQLETLKDMYNGLNINDDTLKGYLLDNPLLVYDIFGDDGCESRTVMLPNGELTKRQSNWHAVVIPSVTIEF